MPVQAMKTININPNDFSSEFIHDINIIDILAQQLGKNNVALVGGAVRDLVMGIEPSDFDVLVRGNFDVVKSIVEKSANYQVVTKNGKSLIRFGKLDISVCSSWEDDAQERDFVINSLIGFINVNSETVYSDVTRKHILSVTYSVQVIDYRGGLSDIDHEVIKLEYDKIEKDPIRLLRLFRFAAKYNLWYDLRAYGSEQEEADNRLTNALKFEPVERIQLELEKALTGNFSSFVTWLAEEFPEVHNYIFPDMLKLKCLDGGKYHDETVWVHTIVTTKAVESMTDKPELIMAAWLHDVGKRKAFDSETGRFIDHETYSAKYAESVLKKLKFPNSFVDEVVFLVENHMRVHKLAEMSDGKVRKFVAKCEAAGVDYMKCLMLGKADIVGNFKKTPLDVEKAFSENLTKIERCLIKNEEGKLHVEKICVNGNDLKQLGFVTGKFLGDVLKRLQSEVDENPILNDYETLMTMAQAAFLDHEDLLS